MIHLIYSSEVSVLWYWIYLINSFSLSAFQYLCIYVYLFKLHIWFIFVSYSHLLSCARWVLSEIGFCLRPASTVLALTLARLIHQYLNECTPPAGRLFDTCPQVTGTHFIRLVRHDDSSTGLGWVGLGCLGLDWVRLKFSSVWFGSVWISLVLSVCYCLWEFGNDLRLMTTRKHSKGRHTSATITTTFKCLSIAREPHQSVCWWCARANYEAIVEPVAEALKLERLFDPNDCRVEAL